MLRFTREQQDFILNERRLSAAMGMAMAANFAATLPMVGNATTLPRQVWEQWDAEILQIQREELPIFNDLASTLSTPIPIGKLVHIFQTVSDSGSVNISLDGRSKAKTDRPLFDNHGTPVPIIDSTFSYGWREMRAAETEGVPLEASGRMNAERKVAEKLESLVLVGDESIVFNGSALTGLRNHPMRATRTTGVTLATATGPQWESEIAATMALLLAKNIYSPVTLYVNYNDWFKAGTTEYTANYPKKIAAAVRELPNIANIIPSQRVLANEIIAIVKRKDMLQLLSAMPMVTRPQARLNPEDEYNFVTMAAAALEIKYDAEGQSAVAVSAPA